MIQNRNGGRKGEQGEGTEEAPTDISGQADPLANTTNEAQGADGGADGNNAKSGKPRGPRERKQRGPPEDGIPSKTKVMVANLPYDLKEEKVYAHILLTLALQLTLFSFWKFSKTTSQLRRKLHFVPSLDLWSRSSKLAMSLAKVVDLDLSRWPRRKCN